MSGVQVPGTGRSRLEAGLYVKKIGIHISGLGMAFVRYTNKEEPRNESLNPCPHSGIVRARISTGGGGMVVLCKMCNIDE